MISNKILGEKVPLYRTTFVATGYLANGAPVETNITYISFNPSNIPNPTWNKEDWASYEDVPSRKEPAVVPFAFNLNTINEYQAATLKRYIQDNHEPMKETDFDDKFITIEQLKERKQIREYYAKRHATQDAKNSLLEEEKGGSGKKRTITRRRRRTIRKKKKKARVLK